jgi:hypothetical protein
MYLIGKRIKMRYSRFQTSHLRVLRQDLLLNPAKILKILMCFFLTKILLKFSKIQVWVFL